MTVFASAAGEEQIEIGEQEPADEVNVDPGEDPDFFEDGPAASDEAYGTFDGSEELSGSGTADISDDVSSSGASDCPDNVSDAGAIDYSDAAGQGQPLPFEQS